MVSIDDIFNEYQIPRYEAEYWINLFKNYEVFAIFKNSGSSIANKESLEHVGKAFALLNILKLPIVIVQGAGEQLNKALEDNHYEYLFIEGIRITKPETIPLIKSVDELVCEQLKEAITKYGGQAKIMEPVVVQASKKKFLYCTEHKVGEVTGIDIEPINRILKQAKIPILMPLGQGSDGLYNINSAEIATELVKVFRPSTYVIITKTGGILDEDGKIISEIYSDEIQSLINAHIVHGNMIENVREIEKALNYVNSARMISSENILKELFTNKGAGTYFSKVRDYAPS